MYQTKKISRNEKIPRKLKKRLLGVKMNKSKLRKLLQSVECNGNGDNVIIKPFEFCPKCGCKNSERITHSVEYPDLWIEDFCLRCGSYVGGADNSYYSHVLEYLNIS